MLKLKNWKRKNWKPKKRLKRPRKRPKRKTRRKNRRKRLKKKGTCRRSPKAKAKGKGTKRLRPPPPLRKNLKNPNRAASARVRKSNDGGRNALGPLRDR